MRERTKGDNTGRNGPRRSAGLHLWMRVLRMVDLLLRIIAELFLLQVLERNGTQNPKFSRWNHSFIHPMIPTSTFFALILKHVI